MPTVMVDRIQIEQVLLNLLNNARQAIQATDKAGTVVLSVKAVQNQVEISIDDDGPGLPAEIRRHLFEPFYTTKLEGEGTGLGLSLCKQFVEAHNGTIEVVEKQEPGTLFVIRLPVC